MVGTELSRSDAVKVAPSQFEDAEAKTSPNMRPCADEPVQRDSSTQELLFVLSGGKETPSASTDRMPGRWEQVQQSPHDDGHEEAGRIGR